jgi:hypothetical protein
MKYNETRILFMVARESFYNGNITSDEYNKILIDIENEIININIEIIKEDVSETITKLIIN